jgi:tRNA(Arg) A34 adenosine deaminase TadA
MSSRSNRNEVIGAVSAGRRRWHRVSIRLAAIGVLVRFAAVAAQPASPAAQAPQRRWIDAAAAMRRLAESRGDQAYGAVLVLDDRLIGEAPSRVVSAANPQAHAEREAIRAAQQTLARTDLRGSILYSTSRPCAACEAAAAQAGVARMFFGESMTDAGAPRQPPAN